MKKPTVYQECDSSEIGNKVLQWCREKLKTNAKVHVSCLYEEFKNDYSEEELNGALYKLGMNGKIVYTDETDTNFAEEFTRIDYITDVR